MPGILRKFSSDKEVSSACIYATALGVYEITLNGKRVEDYYMAPGWTDYHKILQYQYYDVTDRLQGTGKENVLELTVGNGWYKGFSALTVSRTGMGIGLLFGQSFMCVIQTGQKR